MTLHDPYVIFRHIGPAHERDVGWTPFEFLVKVFLVVESDLCRAGLPDSRAVLVSVLILAHVLHSNPEVSLHVPLVVDDSNSMYQGEGTE